MKLIHVFLLSLFLYSSSIWAQSNELSTPKQYEIANISIAIDKLWKEGLFADVQIYASKIVEDKIYITIELKERPRLNNLTIVGLRKNETENVKDEIKLTRGTQITDNVIQTARSTIKKYFTEKGFYNVDIEVIQKPDSSMNSNLSNLTFKIDKKRVFMCNLYVGRLRTNIFQ